MKKILLIIAYLLSMGTLQQVKAQLPVPSSGLVAFYSLNSYNGIATIGNPYGGNDTYSLTNSSVAAASNRFGTGQEAGLFQNSCLVATNGSPWSITGSEISISFWYKTASSSYAGIIDNSQATTANGWGIDNFNSHFRFLGGGNFSGPAYKTDGAWHHVVFVKSENKGVFYFDNVATDSTTAMIALTAPTATIQFNIGRRNNITSYLQNTSLDDIAIYNRALTRYEVRKIYHYSSYQCSQTYGEVAISGCGYAVYQNSAGYYAQYNQSGSYPLTMPNLTASGCDSLVMVNATVYPYPATPEVTVTGNTLSTPNLGAGYSYIWYLNNLTNDVGSGPTYQATQSGNYTVAISNGHCEAIGDWKNVTLTGIGKTTDNNLLQLAPNPASSSVSLTTNQPSTIKITDFAGKVVYNAATAETNTTISTANFANGIYMVQVISKDNIATKKLVISK
ncbi:Por secretion system C-terminal sorting domain-containing protein [Flexibacter flexilis DSM 6793]|uniref:Por secretion system C-terminal sorting domain-containing protein n=1 Tax=Flexibacter flexilis DSM 6793 TaxID=927664 RepID=A0A1I1MGV0_9BACT|nr:LamG-like jellyroll fold domain-containing protein [Flexibacter flexilis]SFC84032.1 Por secretion system C-terminal sorting domain-containing protein [Flexibacter flexilis DSM 6793]